MYSSKATTGAKEIEVPETKDLLFAKQLLVAPVNFSHALLGPWKTEKINFEFRLFCHPFLNIHRAEGPSLTLIGLGMFLDPNQPTWDDQSILLNIVKHASDFDQLETALAKLGGRWLLIAKAEPHIRIYHDATGQKPIFYVDKNAEGLFVASQPSLLSELGIAERDNSLFATFDKYNNSGSWPICRVPFLHVHQVLPNHFLSLNERETRRYWPPEVLATRTLAQATEEMLPILRGIISAAAARSDCAMNLTGGYDSRLALAAAKPIWNATEFFTVTRSDSPFHDISIPKRLAKTYSLKYSLVAVRDAEKHGGLTNDELNTILLRNVGGMYYDGSIQATKTNRLLYQCRIHLPAIVSEVNRCFYYKGGNHPEKISGNELAERAGFKGNRIAEGGFQEWLDSLPSRPPVNTLDLLYWEHRLGVWSSCGLTFREAILEQVPPMNCRNFLEIGLSTAVENRREPYALVRELIRRADPSLLSIPFNRHWRDELRASFKILPRILRRFRG